MSPKKEVMRVRAVRMTDEQWDAAKYLGDVELRRLILQAAKRKKKKEIA